MYTSAPNLTPKGQTFLSALIVFMLIMMASTIADLVVNIYPFKTDNVQWRFSAAGVYLNTLGALGVQGILLVGLAALGRSRSPVKWASIVALVLSVIGIVIVPSYLLDFAQSRLQVPYDRRASFDLVSLKTGGFGALTVLLLMWVGWKGLKASADGLAKGSRNKGDGLVIGQ